MAWPRDGMRKEGQKERGSMFLVLAILLAVAYVVSLVVVHTAPLFIHLLIVLAVVSLVFHLLRGRTA
jgi:Flp pilus assembly protein TadB